MKQQPSQCKREHLSYKTLILLLIHMLSLTACGQAVGTSTALPPDLTPTTAVATTTGVPPAPTLTAYAAATLTVGEILAEIHSAGATTVAAEARGALTTVPMEQTALARPSPTLYIFPTPWPTSAAEPTPVVGQQSGEHCPTSIHGFHPSGRCWIVLLDNEYVYIDSGYAYNVASGDLSDTSIGTLLVFTRPLTLAGVGPSAFYPTPQRLGPVHIAAVDGFLVTVVTDDPGTNVSFAFDLATRQWVTPAPSPVPSLPPTP